MILPPLKLFLPERGQNFIARLEGSYGRIGLLGFASDAYITSIVYRWSLAGG
jgi:hypothetical protein